MLIKNIKFTIAGILALLALGLVGYTGIEIFSFNIIYNLEGILLGGCMITFLSLISGALFTSTFHTAKYKRNSKWVALSLIFTFYLFIIVNLLFTSRSYWYMKPTFDGILARFKNSANFIPFKTIIAYLTSSPYLNSNIILANLFGNLFLMIPMGFFLPIYISKLKKILPFIITMIFGILFIEFIQLATNIGFFDIDDLILNLLGALVAFFLCRISFIAKIIDKFKT
jgi:glycopeptide antibiotics resistance protein